MRMRRRPVELHINQERWLVSYADFVTLLFAFFVVMYSISQVNESKYRVLSATLTEIFNEPKRTLEPIQIGELSRSSNPELIDSKKLHQEATSQGAFEKTADLAQLSDQFTEQFSDLIDDKVVQVNSNEFWLQISLSNSILFPLGSVQPNDEALPMMSEVAELLADFNNPVQVEGYTDNIPIQSQQFPSNWELSSARAAAIVKLLVEQGINPSRLSAVGYGEHQPITENETPEGRAKNRRVVLMIAREKVERPRVSRYESVVEAVRKSDIEKSQINPQPGLQDKTSESNGGLTPIEKMDALIEANPNLGLDTILQLETKENSKKTETIEGEPITPVETKRGGLLFSSDPDLPRNE